MTPRAYRPLQIKDQTSYWGQLAIVKAYFGLVGLIIVFFFGGGGGVGAYGGPMVVL